jgi:uncharacterized protein YbjT (DUF2867 family)
MQGSMLMREEHIMIDEVTLVTGAAGGQQGKTGRRVSEMLLAKGRKVRCLVRKRDERAEQLRARGAEICEGDLLDFHSIRRAVEGVTAVYFAYPVQEGLLDATAIMAAAAREAKVSRLIDLEMLQSSPDAPTPRMRQNNLSERVFEWAQIGANHVRAAVFYENVRELVRPSLGSPGPIRMPWGSDRTLIPLVSGEDVARVATGLLTGRATSNGQAYPLVGAVLTVREIVATLSKVLRRDLEYSPISDEAWCEGALGMGLGAHAVEHLSSLWRFLRERSEDYAVTESIERLGGAPPKSFEAFVREQRERLLPMTSSPLRAGVAHAG